METKVMTMWLASIALMVEVTTITLIMEHCRHIVCTLRLYTINVNLKLKKLIIYLYIFSKLTTIYARQRYNS